MIKMNLKDFPADIITTIVSYLPQQTKVDFLLTCYDFYTLAIPVLYKKLILKRTSILSENELRYNKYTVIGTANNILLNDEVHDKVYRARQEILLQSLQVNPELLSYIEEVVIFDHHKNTYESSGSHLINQHLIDLIKTECLNLQEFLVFNSNPSLHLTKFDHFKNLKACMINHVYQLQHLPLTVKKLTVNFTDSYKKEIDESITVDKDHCLKLLSNLSSLILSSDELSSYIFLKFVIETLKPLQKLKLSTFKLIFYHGFNDYNLALRNLTKLFVFEFVDLTTLKNLEIIMGCDDKQCDCLTDFLDELNCQTNFHKVLNEKNLLNLQKVSIIEKTLHLNHNFQEKFDIALGRFLYNLPFPEKVKYLTIRHQPPLDGCIENGVEGNFLRRKKLYSHCLLKLINLEFFISPTFLQVCSCYEVVTSDLLWNGCRCSFCEQHLALFDEFIITHNYYDETSGTLKDVITPRFFSIAGDSISKRLISYNDISYNCSDLQILEFPVFKSYWNFHSYFDFKHHESESLCHFNQSVFQSLCKVISHFEETFADDLVAMLPKLKIICLSGIFFQHIQNQRPLNCVYDSVETKKNIIGPHDYVLPNA